MAAGTRGGRVRTLVGAGAAACAAGVAIILVLHVVEPTSAISPVRRTISEYGLTSLAWAFNTGVLLLAAGSLAILAADASAGAATRAGLAAGALWVLGLVTVVAFPKHNWAVGPSVTGQVHRMASLVAFLALPVAVLALVRGRAGRGLPGRNRAGWALGLALASLAWFTPIVAALVVVGRGGAWWLAVPLGLIERGMAATQVAALIVLGYWAVVVASTVVTVGSVTTPLDVTVRSVTLPAPTTAQRPVPAAGPASMMPVTDRPAS